MSQGQEHLHLNIKAEDMSMEKVGTTYYSDDNLDHTTSENLKPVVDVTLTGGDIDVNYKCTANLTVSVLQSGTTATITFEENEAKVKLAGDTGWNLGNLSTEFDLSTIKESGYKKTDNVTLNLSGSDIGTPKYIKGQLSIKNLEDKDQTSRLKDQEFTVEVKVENFKCDTVSGE